MKIRKGFVSNSSSSSFIVIGEGELQFPDYEDQIFVIGGSGETEFGWEVVKYEFMSDRINFAAIQAMQIDQMNDNEEMMNRLINIIKECTKCKEVDCMLTLDYSDKTKDYAYIDHQSSSDAGRNIEMFEDDQSLIRFLFAEDSYIQGDNDNY